MVRYTPGMWEPSEQAMTAEMREELDGKHEQQVAEQQRQREKEKKMKEQREKEEREEAQQKVKDRASRLVNEWKRPMAIATWDEEPSGDQAEIRWRAISQESFWKSHLSIVK